MWLQGVMCQLYAPRLSLMTKGVAVSVFRKSFTILHGKPNPIYWRVGIIPGKPQGYRKLLM